MAPGYPSEKGQPSLKRLERAQTSTGPEAGLPRSTRQGSLLQETDLTTPDAADNDTAPPAYNDIYGYSEIHNEKDGLGTSAAVTDDGRVDIRINQLNRRLSSIFNPALRQQLQSVQESHAPPALDGLPPPPGLNLVIQVVGSRGDVQPFVALGKVLKTYGHRVRLATHPNFKDFVRENGLEFFSIGGDPSQLMAFMVKNPGLMPGFRSIISGDVAQRRRDVAEYIQGCWRSCYKTGDGMDDDDPETATRPFVADCIIANPPSFAHIHCAEKLGIPLHMMFTMPYSPTQSFPHPLANIQSTNADAQLTNYISYAMIEMLSWQGLGDIINRFRKKCLGLEPISSVRAPGMLHRLKIPHTYCWSPALIPKPKDWAPHISISGFYLLSSDYTPDPDLQAFLADGPTPVYIGFGSIVLDDPNAMTELIFEAVRMTGQRVLLSKGWGGIGADDIPEGVFMLGNVPHDWLFKHVSCVVHHGGAGTTAAGIVAGRPTVVVPFFGDQAFWGAMVARAGAGPNPIPHKQLTAERLAEAINFCLLPQSQLRARELAGKIEEERGSDTGAQYFHQHLDVDRLRCTLAPSRPATWKLRRIKHISRTRVRLSAFAACTLANAKLLDMDDLKLFRPHEHYTDEGAADPISGGFTACLSAVNNMGMGLVEVPTETWKAFAGPSGSSRQQSQASGSIATKKSRGSTLTLGEESTLPSSLGQSETSLDTQHSLVRTQSPSKLSKRSISTVSGASASQQSSKPDKPGKDKSQSQAPSNSRREYDMLRPSGAHTSKGAGRFGRALIQAPMEVSVGLTKGLHNLPKVWGDDTVRPNERVGDFKSGMRAMGREFGFGWYDGITGLVTQPWQGAKKEGALGFVKGIGKGAGGFIAKPGAASLGILSHSMKGIHKEVQKSFGSDVQSYILASRVAQGHEEWLQSSEAEKQDVIDRWKMIQKYLKKKKHDNDDIMNDILEAQRKKKTESVYAASSAEYAPSAGASTREAEIAMVDMEDSGSSLGTRYSFAPESPVSEDSLDAGPVNGGTRPIDRKSSRKSRGGHASPVQTTLEEAYQVQHQTQTNQCHQADEQNLRRAMTASEAETQQHANDELEYEKQLQRAMTESLRATGLRQTSKEPNVDTPTRNEQIPKLSRTSTGISRKPVPVRQPTAPNDPGHLAGMMRSEFEAQQRGEKTARERMEEDVVLEYIKKQSLLESHHRKTAKSPTTTTEDSDEELQKALKLSMQGNDHKRHGEGSGT